MINTPVSVVLCPFKEVRFPVNEHYIGFYINLAICDITIFTSSLIFGAFRLSSVYVDDKRAYELIGTALEEVKCG